MACEYNTDEREEVDTVFDIYRMSSGRKRDYERCIWNDEFLNIKNEVIRRTRDVVDCASETKYTIR